MKRTFELPELPTIEIDVVRDVTKELPADQGFLRMRRSVLRNKRPDGTWSEEYRYDAVERVAMDAVAILLTSGQGADKTICLRSSLRPPLAFRPQFTLAVPEEKAAPVIWEIPAGLIELDERGHEGIANCASRETMEEVGIDVPGSQFRFLGAAVTLSPGVIAEKIHFLLAHVDASKRATPTEDGSPVEADAEICFVPLVYVRDLLARGEIQDAKTEIGLWRVLAAEGLL